MYILVNTDILTQWNIRNEKLQFIPLVTQAIIDKTT